MMPDASNWLQATQLAGTLCCVCTALRCARLQELLRAAEDRVGREAAARVAAERRVELLEQRLGAARVALAAADASLAEAMRAGDVGQPS